MRNADAVLSVIQNRGKRGLHLEDVYRQMFNPELYLRAYDRLYRNKGAMTRGATGETVDGMSMRRVQAIIDLIRHERYQWTPVRRTHIPKKGGKLRPLGIPTWSDKLVQEVMRSILEAYYEPQFSDRSHGFRPGRGCHTALGKVYYSWKSVKWFVEGDIKGCFDNIDHSVLLAILRDKIHDGRFVALVDKLLRAGYLEDWDYSPTYSGTPQGGVVSPILANIYLDRLDKFVEERLIPEYTRGVKRKWHSEYARVRMQMVRYRKIGKVEEYRATRRYLRTLPTADPNDPGFRRLHYTRYADDFLLGFAGPRAEAEAIKESIRAFLREHLKLEMSEEKTLVTHARTDVARFLGYEIAAMHCNSRRTVNGQLELRIPSDVVERTCQRYMENGKPVHRTTLFNGSDYLIVARYGMEYRGVVQYYGLARNIGWLSRLRWVMQVSLCKTLANKHKSTARRMARKYAGITLTPEGEVRKCLRVVVNRDASGKQPLVATFGGISLKRKKYASLVDGPAICPPRKCSELLQRLCADRCEWCGGTDDVGVHHVRALADLQGCGEQERPHWMQFMTARRRKTLVLCVRCHDDLHAGRLGVRLIQD